MEIEREQIEEIASALVAVIAIVAQTGIVGINNKDITRALVCLNQLHKTIKEE